MLSRVVRIPLRYSLSGVLRAPFSNVPEVIKKNKEQMDGLVHIQNQIANDDIDTHIINFTGQNDDKKTILQAIPELRYNFNTADFSTVLFTFGGVYGLLANFNYLLTLGCLAGSLITNMTIGQRNLVREKKVITMIEVDKSDKLHVKYFGPNGIDDLIVDKSKFTFNVLKSEMSGSDTIWCKIDGEDFWISEDNLQINNHNLHHLL